MIDKLVRGSIKDLFNIGSLNENFLIGKITEVWYFKLPSIGVGNFLIQEDGTFILMEDGSNIELEN